MSVYSQVENKPIEKVSDQSLHSNYSNDGIKTANSRQQVYDGKEVKFVKKAGSNNQSNLKTELNSSANDATISTTAEGSYSQSNILISNINFSKVDPKVLDKLNENKLNHKDLLQSIYLVYLFETGNDSMNTTYQNLERVWKKEKHFINLKEYAKNKFKLCLSAYFDTELSEEIMVNNNLTVIFKDEYYTVQEIEK
jgi:hypothetical protein